MRVALVGARRFPAGHGGLEVAVAALAREYAARGHDVHVVCNDSSGQTMPGVEIHEVAAIRTKHLHTASQVLASQQVISSLRPDVVHVHGVGASFPLLIQGRDRREQTFLTCHGIDWNREKWSPGARAVFAGVCRRSIKRAAAVSAVSSPVAAELSDFVERPVVTIPNGLDLPQLRAERPVGLPERYLVTTCRLTPEKNVESLVAAFDNPAVAERFGALVVVGGSQTSYSDGYEKDLRDLAGPSVHFAGARSRDETLRIVADAEAFASASRLEAHPLAVLEAIALGRPVLLSDIPAHRATAPDASFFPIDDAGAVEKSLLDAPLKVSQTAIPDWRTIAGHYLDWFGGSK